LTRRKFTSAFLMWTVAFALLIGAIIWLLWPRAMAVEAASIDRGEVRRELEEEGRVRFRDIFVVAAPVGGLLKRIDLEPGQQVSRSGVIARIQPSAPGLLDSRSAQEATAAIAAARAALAAAGADLEIANTNAQRIRQLFEREFASKASLDRAEATVKAAQAAVDLRKAELRRAEAVLSQSASRATEIVVKSPAEGQILRLLQESESVVAAGTPLLEVGDPSRIEVVAEFLSRDAVLIEEGACAYVLLGAGAVLPGQVMRVEPYASTKVSALGVEEQRANVVVSLEPTLETRRLGHGYQVDVRILVFREPDALRVPTDALFRQSNGEWAAFRIANGRALHTAVRLGDGDDRFRVVLDGLSEGDSVVLFPGDELRDGDRVTAKLQ
jgi:HlyD family secretion protein